jgi:hypothetical protein
MTVLCMDMFILPLFILLECPNWDARFCLPRVYGVGLVTEQQHFRVRARMDF